MADAQYKTIREVYVMDVLLFGCAHCGQRNCGLNMMWL